MSNQEYEFKRLSQEQLPVVQSLFLRSFGVRIPLETLRKKYDTSVFGKRDIGYLAYQITTGDPAAYYGVFPISVKVKGQLILACQSGDTMTAPEHRRKGLFMQLARKTFELATEEGIQFVFGFPNSQSYRGFEKLNWSFYGNMVDFKIKSGAIPFALLAKKIPFLERVYNARLKKVIQKICVDNQERSSELFKGMSNFQVERDKSLVAYKAQENIGVVQLDDFVFWIKASGTLQVGDVANFDSGRELEMINALKKLARKLGCSKIVFSFSENHWIVPRLKKVISPQKGLSIGLYSFDKEKEFSFEEATFSMLDFDTF